MRAIRVISGFVLLAVTGGFIAERYAVSTEVDYFPVKPRVTVLEITGPGLLDAINKVVITARIQGFLLSIETDKNYSVSKGQVLASLESTDLRNQLAAAQADAQAAKNAVLEANSERDRARAMLAKAKLDFERRSELLKRQVVSAAQFADAEAAFKEAEANFARTTTAIDRSEAKSLSSEATVNVLQARLAEATIRSPINGVVVSRERNVGDLLSPGAALLMIVDPDSIIVSARFDESTLSAIRPGQEAKVRFSSNPGTVHNGQVFRLTRQVDVETREFTADVKLDALPSDWALGQRANVSISSRPPMLVMSVPQKFIARESGQAGVWIERRQRAVWQRVSLGYLSGSNVEVTSGLEADDVVLDPRGRYLYQPVSLRKEVH